MNRLVIMLMSIATIVSACEKVDHSGEKGEENKPHISLDEVAQIFSELPIGREHVLEVFDAVSTSSNNGYDEEYTMLDLFTSPGAGVGESEETKAISACAYSHPLRELIANHLLQTKASSISPEEYMSMLESSDIQIYWPYYEGWDGEMRPVITFDPGNGAEVNYGYELIDKADGSQEVKQVIVDENMALSRPVWVINRNSDSGYESIEMIKKRNPEWGSGGSIIIKPSSEKDLQQTSTSVRSLVLKDFKMLRNYDCWFAGASEFFIKCGGVEDFTASTEAELKLYSPKITDFMLVLRRNQVGKTVNLNTVLISQWTEQLESVALMIVEDDGGTKTEWKCSAMVKVKSKSFGFDISLPFNSRDDIVWRGQLSVPYLEKYDNVTSRFGDVEMTFSLVE